MNAIRKFFRGFLRQDAPKAPPPGSCEHPAAANIPPEFRRYMESYAITNVRYPPYQEGYPGLISGEWFMRTYQNELLSRIENSVGLPRDEYQRYLEPVLVQFAELAHLLPASENHHHNGPGGLLRHSLEVANLAMDKCLSAAFDAREIPARRSLRRFRWNVAGVIAGLLHDAGKPLSDITAIDLTGEHRWNYGAETLHQWSTRLGIQRYFLLWNADRHGRHVETSLMLLGRLVPTATIEWLLEGGPDIQQAMIEAVAGSGKTVLAEAVRWADGRSVDREMRRGSRTGSGGDTGVPVPRLVLDAMQRLLSDGRWTANTPGSRVWTTVDGIFIAWTQGAEEVVNLIAQDGMPIPRTHDTLAGVLQSHGIIEPPPTGELYWLVTPHPLMRDGRGPALKCVKLVDGEQLYPFTQIPPPVSVSIGREGDQQVLLALNDPQAASTPAPEAVPPQVAEVKEDPLAAICGPLPGASEVPADAAPRASAPAKDKGKKAAPPKMLPDLPAAASEGITLAPAPAAAEPAADATTLPEMEEAQPEEAEEVEAFSLDEMLMGLTPHVPEPPAAPAPEAVATPDATAAPAPAAAQSHFPLAPGEKIPLDVLLGKRKPNKAQKAALRLEVAPPPAPPKAAAAEPQRPEPATPPAAAPGWVVPPEITAQLTRREVLLLQQQPVLAQKLLHIEDNRVDARHVYNKVFLAFKSSAFSEDDVPALLAAGWVWQDILAEGDGIVRTLQRVRGVVLSGDYSRILTRLLGMEKRWIVPSTDDLTEAELDALPAIIDAVIAAAQLDGTTSIPLWFVTPAVLAKIAERHCMTSERLQFALLATRDAVYSAVRRRTYVRPVPEDLQCRNA